ncbi:hypothetical protein DPMN_110094 [Dreissena polymorpha]|uniref:Uncharacterized protein n=1 Tax=Dreissena polymorpha TaxID=45954 RepID=A0A9D4KBG1_DREPO|nr:hypothetical protein DPMN_110094 [Dreissena polymorpha]
MHVYLMELQLLSGEKSKSSFKVKGDPEYAGFNVDHHHIRAARIWTAARTPRETTEASAANIVLYEWLPLWLSINSSMAITEIIPEYKGYNPNIHPGITQEFATAAMRFGHTLVTPGTWVRQVSLDVIHITVTSLAMTYLGQVSLDVIHITVAALAMTYLGKASIP